MVNTPKFLRSGPVKQFLGVLVIASLAILLIGYFSVNDQVEWFIATTALGFYAWMNAVFSFFRQKRISPYIILSIVLYFLLAALLHGEAYLIASTDYFSMPEYRTMTIATTIFYIFALLIAALIRGVAEFMQIY